MTETSHHLHFLFYYRTKCKLQFEMEKVAKNKNSLLKIGCFEVKWLTLLATFNKKLPQRIRGSNFSNVQLTQLQYSGIATAGSTGSTEPPNSELIRGPIVLAPDSTLPVGWSLGPRLGINVQRGKKSL